MLITLKKSKPIILIDSSYYVFYRYFATYKWYTMQKKEFDEQTFNESFIKHMSSDIKKLTKKWKTDINNIVFCCDCPRSKIWRNDIYKGYKITRQQNQNFNQNIFNVFKNNIETNNYNIINIDRLEADDIIYLMHSKIKTEHNNIIVITNDNDYLQLLCDGTTIINMQFKNINVRTNCTDGKSNLYYKSLIGDKSDNIPKISSLVNKELASKLCENYEDLVDWLNKNNIYDKFMFNLKLISFEYIPDEYVNIFNKTYKIDVN